MTLAIIVIVAGLMFGIERLWPSMDLPKVRNWWARVALINAVQLGIVILAGFTWDRWMEPYALLRLRDSFGTITQASIAYFVSTFIYYWWHRIRHESNFFWLICHQLHHSPQRIELFTSFYKHPLEITINSILSAAIVFPLLGCSVQAAAIYTLMTAIAEFIYHWNINTPHWVGYLFQRPEAHRVHHQYDHHKQNFADLPIWDMLFGTFNNPKRFASTCGYDNWREDRFEDQLAFRDVHSPDASERRPLQFLPTCIGCSKREACAAGRADSSD